MNALDLASLGGEGEGLRCNAREARGLIREVFEMRIPNVTEAYSSGLEGVIVSVRNSYELFLVAGCGT